MACVCAHDTWGSAKAFIRYNPISKLFYTPKKSEMVLKDDAREELNFGFSKKMAFA